MASNVMKSILYVQIAFLKREFISLLFVVALYFLVLRFTIVHPNGRQIEEEAVPKCNPLLPYYYCNHQVSRGQIFHGTERINNFLEGMYVKTENTKPDLEFWTSCCIKNKPPDGFDECAFGDFKTKTIIVYPDTSKIRTLFNNARLKWTDKIYSNLNYTTVLRDDLYTASNIVIIVKEFSWENLVYTIRNNVYSKNYQKDGSHSARVAQMDWLGSPNIPNQSSIEFLIIQTAVNEAFVHYLDVESDDWRFCTYSNYDRYTNYQSYDKENYELAEKTDRLNSWLYISTSVLLVKLVSDLMNSCNFVKLLKFHNVDPTSVYFLKALLYIIVHFIVSIPFMVSTSFGYINLFPCIEVKITLLALGTFYVCSVSFITLAASFFSKKSKGLCVVLVVWAMLHFICKWIIDYAPNTTTLLLISMFPAGGLYSMLNTMLTSEVVDHRDSILFDWPLTPTNMLPLALIVFMMWLGTACNLILLYFIQKRQAHSNVYQNTHWPFNHILSNIVENCRAERLPQSDTKTEKLKNMIRECAEANPKKDVEKGTHLLIVSFPNESIPLENYSVLQNTITVILGGRLSGKSDLLSKFAKNPFCGRISIIGDSVSTEDPVEFYTHQCPLVENLTTFDHLVFSALQRGFSRMDAMNLCVDIMINMKLTHVLCSWIDELGALEKFKVALSVALMGNPKILVLDELTSKLDHAERAEAWKLLLELRRKCTIVLSTTSPDEADSIGDYVGIIDQQRLLNFGTIPNLRRLYNEQYTIRFTPEASRLREVADELSKKSQNVNQEDSKIVVSCQEDDEVAKILELAEDYVDLSKCRIETFHPRMQNMYVKAIGCDIRESSDVLSSFFKEETTKLNSKWWTKVRAHYVRILWHNQSSLLLAIVLCAIFWLMFYPRMDECFNHNYKLREIPIKTSYFSVPHANITFYTDKIKQKEYFKMLSNNFYVPSLAVDQIYNSFLSRYGSARITTYYHPFVAIPSACFDLQDNLWLFKNTAKNYESCMLSFMKAAKYMFFSCTLVLTIVHNSERTKDMLKILYFSGSNAFIYWFSAFLASATLITAITVMIIIQAVLIIPTNELLSDLDTYWTMTMLFLYGLSFINYNFFISLFINKKSVLIVACVFFACISLFHTFTSIISTLFLPDETYVHSAWESIEESLKNHYFYNPLMAPLPPNLAGKYYCSICKDTWLDPRTQREELNEEDFYVLASSLLLTVPTLFYFLLVIMKDSKCLCRCFMSCYKRCTNYSPSELEQVGVKWKIFEEESEGKLTYDLVIDCPVGKQLPDGVWKKRKITLKRGTCLGILRRGDSKTSKFMKAIMKMPCTKFGKYLFDNSVSNTLGYCPRKGELHNKMTARQQLSFFARFRGVSKVNKLVNSWLNVMGIEDIADCYAGEYDVSSRKKLGVALALIGSPFLAVLEDPTAGVDIRSRLRILSVIKHCCEVMHQSIIVVTEDYNDCVDLSNQIVILNDNLIEFNDDLTTLKYSLCQEPVLLVKLSASSSNHDIEDVKNWFLFEFPDMKIVSERGVWQRFVFPPTYNLSALIHRANKLKVNQPIVQELFIISSSVDCILEKLEVEPKKTAYSIIKNWMTESIESLKQRSRAIYTLTIVYHITILFFLFLVLHYSFAYAKHTNNHRRHTDD